MNVHHLELFYYVARFEGITQAVRRMPYGIQQPAVSGQILQLEKDLGVKLFERRPFALTPAGEDLYEYVYPFFSRLGEVGERLRGEESRHLRLAASAAVLTTHLPRVLNTVKKAVPDLRLTLREVVTSEVETLLLNQEVDLAISVVYGKSAPAIKCVELLRLPLILLANKDAPEKTFNALAKDARDGEIRAPLISHPPHEFVSKLFREELTRRGLRWQATVEVNALELVHPYVRNGFGFGLSVEIPGMEISKGVRQINLPRFPALVIGLMHTGKLRGLAADFAEQARRYARDLGRKKK